MRVICVRVLCCVVACCVVLCGTASGLKERPRLPQGIDARRKDTKGPEYHMVEFQFSDAEVSPWQEVMKRVFCAMFIYKTIILLRQARDKHREII